MQGAASMRGECMQGIWRDTEAGRRTQAHSDASRHTQAHPSTLKHTQAHSSALKCTQTRSEGEHLPLRAQGVSISRCERTCFTASSTAFAWRRSASAAASCSTFASDWS